MIFNENRLLTDDSHVISYLIVVENWENLSQNLSSAAVVIGALRVNNICKQFRPIRYVKPDMVPNCLTLKGFLKYLLKKKMI